VALILIVAFLISAGAIEPPMEAPITPGAIPLEDRGRYKSPRTYEETLDFYQRTFKQSSGIRWRNVVNLPSIKAKHIECLRKKTHWEGINIYEKQGEVRIYVIPRDAAEKEPGAEKRRGAKT
jgi:hypothetical protein